MEKRLLTEIANNIGNDNKSVDELIDTIMKSVEKWAKEHKGELKRLTPEQRERLTQPTYLVRQIAEIEYAKENLRKIVYKNLKRAQGNLGEEEKMLGLYDTLEKFNYSCPYSDTLLIGGEQPIHLEHIIPVTMGGPTDDWNCIPVCGSCNDSKGNRHLLDWWNDNRTVEEEYKLVKIFEHITSKLLDNANQIRYVETEDNTKHLDVITFLNQLLDHIEQNKQYILGPNTSILDDNTKAIESKLKELRKTFERVVKKNSDKTLKTDKQYFKEQKQMLKYVKGLGVRSYYKVAYNYFDEIQDMLNRGVDEEEIRQFCFDRDDSFSFTLFYEKLIEYKEKNGSFAGVRTDKEIGSTIANIRKAYKYKYDETKKGLYKLTPEMIDKLNAIGFPWDAEYGQWFEPFLKKLLEYRDKEVIDDSGNIIKPKGSFIRLSTDDYLKNVVNNVRQAYKYRDLKTDRRFNILTSQMIEKLNEIGFPWETDKNELYGQWFEDFYLKLIAYKERNGGFDRVQQDDEIGTLVASVRSGYSGKRKTRLTNEMINKLNAIGFPWVVREKDWFTIFYKKLIDYRDGEIEQNGRIIKPKGSFDLVVRDKEIGVKVNHIRKAYKYKDDPTKKGLMQLTEEIIARLDAIGFPWEVAKEDRYRDWFTPFYEKLTKYKEEKGRFWGVTNDKDIGKIVGSVRTAYKYKDDENKKVSYRLTQEMIDKLNAIGFPWEARAKKIQEDVLSV